MRSELGWKSDPGFRCAQSGLRAMAPRPLRRKPELHHVAVGDLVLLAFEPQLASLARAGLALAPDVIVVGDRLGADEAALEISVDRARRLRRARALGHGPGARLLR